MKSKPFSRILRKLKTKQRKYSFFLTPHMVEPYLLDVFVFVSPKRVSTEFLPPNGGRPIEIDRPEVPVGKRGWAPLTTFLVLK